MANSFCPLIKDKCKKSQCMLWGEGKIVYEEEGKETTDCLLLAYMITQVQRYEMEFVQAEIASRKPEIPPDLEKKSTEELASELRDYIKKEFPDVKEGFELD